MALCYGFDGWLINIEKTFAVGHWDPLMLQGFITQLKLELGCGGRVIWYDALTKNNNIAFQNGLTDKNIEFVRSAGSILTNYEWNSDLARQAKAMAVSNLLPPEDVFFGIDVWAQNHGNPKRVTYPPHNGGGTNVGVAVARLSDFGLASGIFAPAWPYQHFPNSARAVERSMWDGDDLPQDLDCSCEHPAGSKSFFYTNFERAFALHDATLDHVYDGKKQHSQVGAQSILPDLPRPARTSQMRRDAVVVVYGELRDSPPRLAILAERVRGAQAEKAVSLTRELVNVDSKVMLFKLDMDNDTSLQARISFRKRDSVTKMKVGFYLRFEDEVCHHENLTSQAESISFLVADIYKGSKRLTELGVYVYGCLLVTQGPVLLLDVLEISMQPPRRSPVQCRIGEIYAVQRDEGEFQHTRLSWKLFTPSSGKEKSTVDHGSQAEGQPYSNLTGPFSHFFVRVNGLKIGRAYAMEFILSKTLARQVENGEYIAVKVIGVLFDGLRVQSKEQRLQVAQEGSLDWQIPRDCRAQPANMADLQALFARLKSPQASEAGGPHPPSAQQPPDIWAQPQPNEYRQPSVSSPILSPPLSGPQPHHESAIMSPNMGTPSSNTPIPDPNRTNNLLNLLRFNQPTASGSLPSLRSGGNAQAGSLQNIFQSDPQAAHPGNQGRTVSSGSVATFSSKPPTSAAFQSSTIGPSTLGKPDARSEVVSSPMENPQDFLLRLLNHPKPSQSDSAATHRLPAPLEAPVSEPAIEGLAQELANATFGTAEQDGSDGSAVKSPGRGREETPIRLFGSGEVDPSTPFEPPQPANKPSIFTYVNPFEQLSASSPRNRTPKPEARSGNVTPKIEILKHGRDISTATNGETSGPATKTRKLASSAASPAPSPLPDGRSQIEALMGIGAETKKHESVAEALSGVAEKVEKQVEQALAQTDAKSNLHPVTKDDSSAELSTMAQAEDAVREAAIEIQEDLKNPESQRALEENMPKPMADAFKSTIADVAQQDVADSWESADAEGSPTKKTEDFVVRVYNFPMKPFVSIEIKAMPEPLPIRQDIVMEIARLKKDFDQLDRTLATASTYHIVYAMSKNGGFRVIRQDSGLDKQVFRHTQDRVFNVAICTANSLSAADFESVIATGVNGSVYWTSITKSRGDAFEEEDLEAQGLIIPPIPGQDDNTSGSALKTRAKKSCRHPNFFAIGRGKAIHIVWPFLARSPQYCDTKTHVVDSEKFFKERCFKIATGKAGKDFAFSEDDSLIVSLDKGGKLKFWDIQQLVEAANETAPTKHAPVEVKVPLWTLSISAPSDKSWPTSVMFVDKERPCVKGVALRYLIVGMKQNHTLQLWDLGLGKPVQELHFPHETESDAICSLSYHPRSGVLAIAHPTRNSIYFVHLSAPKYNLPPYKQAQYIHKLATRDPTVPRPESTAIMSGLREFSFSSKGQVRSMNMLTTPNPSAGSDPEDAAMFELYVMHSRGVTALTIKKEDLGWGPDGKVLHPIDAEGMGAIEVKDIQVLLQNPVASDLSANGESAPPVTPKAVPPKTETKQDAARAVVVNGNDKAEKKKKKQRSTAEPEKGTSEPAATNPPLVTPASYAMAVQRPQSPPLAPVHRSTPAPAPAATINDNGPQHAAASNGPTYNDANRNEQSAPGESPASISRQLDALYRRIDEDKRVQYASAEAKQDALLRLVSSTLTDNVDKSISRIVSTNIQQTVLPAISDVTTAVLDRRVSEVLAQQLGASIPKEVKHALPAAVGKAMQEPEVLRLVAELVANKVSGVVDSHFTTALRNSIVPNFTSHAMTAAQNMASEIERRTTEQLRQAEVQRNEDSVKIEQLTSLVRSLSETVREMAAGQSVFQQEILKMQRSAAQPVKEPASNRSVTSIRSTPAPTLSVEEEELQSITSLMTEGRYEEGTIQWLQSPRQAELFDRLFVRCNPAYLQRLSQLVALSVSAAVTASFETHIVERLMWLESVFSTIDLKDPDVQDVAPKIMEVLSQRLQALYMQIAESSRNDPNLLRKVSALAKHADRLKTVG
ncbi:hypothetical protein B0A49_11037 [Cryomyces minteri]|uniref:Uncharacterized protein n=3 Tax=Cryomyces TaxID=329878 RepID=A0A4V5NEC8_9PEZI|nr:hypothetical protein B0A49_11037 [Cryomyces minteri]